MTARSGRRQPRAAGLAPHQVGFIDTVLASKVPTRLLLAGPPGAGKSAAISASIGALGAERKRPLRCLIVAPASMMLSNWRAVLGRYGSADSEIVDAPTYRRFQAAAEAGASVWASHSCLITSPAFLNVRSRLDEALRQKWDVVVLDEAHRFSTGTQRGRLAKAIWDSNNVTLAIAESSFADQPDWLVRHPVTQIIRWSRGTLENWDQHPLMVERRIETVRFQLSTPEIAFADRLVDALRSLEAGPSTAGFVAQDLRQRWASSLYAIDQSLRRHASGSIASEEPEFDELDAWSSPNVNHPRTDKAPALLPQEVCYELLELIEQIDQDSKWRSCRDLLSSLRSRQKYGVIVFTEYADTAGYLGDLSGGEGWPTCVVTGKESPEDRWMEIDRARRERAIVIITSRAAEGVNLTFTDRAIHYDLPQTTQRLLQRFARTEWYSTKFITVHHYVFIDGVTTTSAAMANLEREIAEADHALD